MESFSLCYPKVGTTPSTGSSYHIFRKYSAWQVCKVYGKPPVRRRTSRRKFPYSALSTITSLQTLSETDLVSSSASIIPLRSRSITIHSHELNFRVACSSFAISAQTFIYRHDNQTFVTKHFYRETMILPSIFRYHVFCWKNSWTLATVGPDGKRNEKNRWLCSFKWPWETWKNGREWKGMFLKRNHTYINEWNELAVFPVSRGVTSSDCFVCIYYLCAYLWYLDSGLLSDVALHENLMSRLYSGVLSFPPLAILGVHHHEKRRPISKVLVKIKNWKRRTQNKKRCRNQ